MIDMEKRRRVMARSAALGHCICNPRQPCPCEPFIEHKGCPCAGERLEDAGVEQDVRLTELVENAGCASKINQKDLKRVLEGLPEITHERLLVGTSACDDAGIYRLSEELALVQTVDVFTPSVDDPYTFGEIAAANSLSDCYAMGGTPITALAVIAFPIETLSHAVMTEMLRGGIDKVGESGAVVVGGHSIKDNEVKFGFAITGTVDPRNMVTNAGARPGDALVLTKPLGVGIIGFARQRGRASEQAMATIAASMAELNDVPARVMVEMGAHAATDVTGFGLLGHLSEMVCQRGVTAEIMANRVPIFDDVLDYIGEQMISGAIERNMEYAQQYVASTDGVDADLAYVLYDPPTSGGFLIAIEEERADELVERLQAEGVEHAAVIGRVVGESDGRIVLSADGEAPAHVVAAAAAVRPTPAARAAAEPCCANPPDLSGDGADGTAPAESEAGAAAAKQAFGAFMGVRNADGAIDLRNKELMAIALSVLPKCEPCVRLHIDKARDMGIGDEEINEAVWMAISFGGAPVMMFYNSVRGQA